jgi:hypothetical protein
MRPLCALCIELRDSLALERPHKRLVRLDDAQTSSESRGFIEQFHCQTCKADWSFDPDRATPWRLKLRGPAPE